MTELMLTRTPSGALAPMDDATLQYLSKLRLGEVLHGKFTRMRNARFHRKAMALFKLAFDSWDAPELEYHGNAVAKNFDRFRRDLTILAGYYDAVTNIRGEVRLEAKSISFASMSEDEFESVYKEVLNVIWERILRSKGYENQDAVESIVEELMRFDS